MRTILTMFLVVASALTCIAADAPVIVQMENDGVQQVEIYANEYSFKPNHRDKGMEAILEVVE